MQNVWSANRTRVIAQLAIWPRTLNAGSRADRLLRVLFRRPSRFWRWSKRNRMTAAMMMLSVALATVVGTLIWEDQFPSSLPANRIAVLPFESLSSDNGNTFFADGVYDGVSSKLAKLANLKVISHESVARYRGAHNTQEIGRALNVPYVLEGSVRREAGQIHLNAKLIDTRTDTQVWAEEYDRDLTRVFALQSEIVQKIADEFDTKVSSTRKPPSKEPPTKDLVAYHRYLRGKQLVDGISFSTRAKEDLLQAVRLLDQAVAHDRSFAIAYYLLAGGA